MTAFKASSMPQMTLEKVDLYWMGISFNENDYGGTQQGW